MSGYPFAPAEAIAPARGPGAVRARLERAHGEVAAARRWPPRFIVRSRWRPARGVGACAGVRRRKTLHALEKEAEEQDRVGDVDLPVVVRIYGIVAGGARATFEEEVE
jgi:hypothetical protein